MLRETNQTGKNQKSNVSTLRETDSTMDSTEELWDCGPGCTPGFPVT